jgi:hypothetical protein
MQIASRVILIRPTGFGHDPQTAPSNAFQRELKDPAVAVRAAEEFDLVLDALRHCGVGITVLDPADPRAPNGVFPNNWFSTHADGRLILYPMHTPSRRVERDPRIRELLAQEGSTVQGTVDLSPLEEKRHYLEGTGSMVLDRVNKLAFACISPRTSEEALKEWGRRMDFTMISFIATMHGRLGEDPVYHTNVVMSIGEDHAVVCLDALPYPAERQEVQEELEKTGRTVVPITIDQMHSFAGNMLQLRGRPLDPKLAEDRYIFLSETAFNSLRPEQRIALQQHGQLVPLAIPTIETVGGGSIRCMLAENFLPAAPSS